MFSMLEVGLESSINSKNHVLFLLFEFEVINPQFKKDLDSIWVLLKLHELIGIKQALNVKQILE